MTPGTAEKAGDQTETTSENVGTASNFAQRIEQKLWKYSASRNVVKRWLLEIISWTLSACCMAGIVIVLICYKDKRIPKWPLGLTLNAYISVLSKVASAALLLPVSEALGQLKWSWFQGSKSQKMWDFEIFDNASRGPWGSLLLLVRTKGKSLAALGAAVTLFALALDPFFQQVVEYADHWKLQTETGSIPVATSYRPYLSGKEYRNGFETIELDPIIMGAAQQFFYDNGTKPTTFGRGVRAEIPLACPYSNCTWPEYETLGICSECTEASDLLEFKCLNTTLDWVQVPGEDPETGEVTFSNGTSCGWYLKADNPLLMAGYNVDSDTPYAGEVLLMRTQPMYDLFTRELIPGYKAKLNNSRNPLEHAIIVSGISLENVMQNKTPIAHECLLSWCVKTMLSAYSEGGYTETIIKTTINNDTSEGTHWLVIPIIDEHNDLSGFDYTYGENVTVTGDSGFVYFADNHTHVLTLSVFDDMFPSTYTIANSTNETDALLRYKQYNLIGPRTRNVTYNPFMHDNVSEHMLHMSNALTDVLRSTSSSDAHMVSGPAYDMESFVDVRWAWLTLPLGLLGLTFIFMVATVIRSSIEQENVGVWKTSAIATLLYGLPDEMQKKITASEMHGTPRAKAKEMKVKWLPKGGWRLSGNTFSSPTSRKSHQSRPLPTPTTPPTPPPNWI
jgi:hypothetical protein